jgi:hypothetical protein
MSEKIWVLTEPKRRGAPDVTTVGGSTSGSGRTEKPTREARPVETPAGPPLGVQSDSPEAWIKVPLTNRRPLDSFQVLLALYSLGGVAPLALRIGSHQFAWAVASIVSLATWVTLVWHWKPVHGLLASGRVPLLPFLLGLVLATGVGLLAWCRALHLAGRDDRYRPERLPRWLVHPWVTGSVGLLIPGAGLLIAGRAWRAALALWNAACVAAAAAILVNASVGWNWNARAGADGLPRAFVEVLLLASAGVVTLGGLLWIASALDGARLVERSKRAKARARAHGDGYALALLVALVALAGTFRPATLARDLDRFATAMRFEGWVLVPLCLESSSAVLDPSRPEYAMRVADIQMQRGNREAARAIHARLRERWENYAQTLLRQETPDLLPAQLQPIQPGAELLEHRNVPKLVRIPPPAPAGAAGGPAAPSATPVPSSNAGVAPSRPADKPAAEAPAKSTSEVQGETQGSSTPSRATEPVEAPSSSSATRKGGTAASTTATPGAAPERAQAD